MNINQWYYTHTGQRHGPVSEDAIRQLIVERKIQPDICSLWQEGMESWVPIANIETFRPSLELIERLDTQIKQDAPEQYCSLQAALDTRKPMQHKPSIFSKHPLFWLILRTFPTALFIAFACAVMDFYYALNAMIIIATVLMWAGWNREKSFTQKVSLGCVSSLSFCFSCHLQNNDAFTSDNLIPLEESGLVAFCEDFSIAKLCILLATFFIPFFMSGHFYHYFFELKRHDNYISID